MIPKILHWCWYGGGERPASVRRTMASWRRVGEGWEERLWSEENCDLSVNEYVRGAAQAGRWALVSDYFRLTALERFGGIYLDTDVECYRSFDDLLPLRCFRDSFFHEASQQWAEWPRPKTRPTSNSSMGKSVRSERACFLPLSFSSG